MRTAVFHVLLFAASASAQSALVIVIKAGGSPNVYENTITVPLNSNYTNELFNGLSGLTLSGAEGVPVDAVSCQAYYDGFSFTGKNGIVPLATPLNSSNPTIFYSTNAFTIEYLICRDTKSSSASGTNSSSSSSSYLPTSPLASARSSNAATLTRGPSSTYSTNGEVAAVATALLGHGVALAGLGVMAML